MTKIWGYIVLFCCLLSFEGQAQDPQFSQFYATPMYLNPAFTGNTKQGRVAAIYRNQWAAIPKAYVSYAVSYDHNLAGANSGIGIIAIHDKAGIGGLKYTSIGGLYSYQLLVNRKIIFRPGVRVSYVSRSIDYSSLTFGTDLTKGQSKVTVINNNMVNQVNYLDISLGTVLYSRDFWVGFAMDHVNKPNQAFITSTETNLPIKYSLHGGVNIKVMKNAKGKGKALITPTFNYKAQEKWDQLDVGAYYTQDMLMVGVWYRGLPIKSYAPGIANNDAVIGMIGLKMKQYQIAYSYDITISRLYSNTGGSHDISIIWEYATKQAIKKRRHQKFMVPCAKF